MPNMICSEHEECPVEDCAAKYKHERGDDCDDICDGMFEFGNECGARCVEVEDEIV